MDKLVKTTEDANSSESIDPDKSIVYGQSDYMTAKSGI